MTKLKKTISQTKQVEVDIDLPYFTKDIAHYYAIISEDEIWCVTDLGDDSLAVLKKHPIQLSYVLDKEESDQNEFWKAYSKAMESLSNFPIEQPLFKEPVKAEE